MTRKELQHIQKILERIKDPDEHVKRALALVAKDLAIYDAYRGQLRDNYEVDQW